MEVDPPLTGKNSDSSFRQAANNQGLNLVPKTPKQSECRDPRYPFWQAWNPTIRAGLYRESRHDLRTREV